MKTTIVLLIAIFLSAAFLHSARAGEKSEASQKVAFVDLDGDGLNDSAADKDNDGIPDAYDSDVPTLAPDTSGVYDYFDLGDLDADLEADIEPIMSNSQAFARARVSMVCLTQSRGGFGSGDNFGPGEGIGCGAVLGGVCEGGVCY